MTKENHLLQIKNLHAEIEGTRILNGLDLSIKPGELHVIMGPNGSGKTTLSQVLAGNEDYNVTEGEVNFKDQDLLDMSADQRSLEGLFLSFQSPIEIPGLGTINFLRTKAKKS